MTTLLVIGCVWFAVAFLFVLCLGLAARRTPIMETADCPVDGEAIAAVELVSRLTALEEAASAPDSEPAQINSAPAYLPSTMQSAARTV